MEVKLFAPLNGGKAGRNQPVQHPDQPQCHQPAEPRGALCSALLVEEGKKRVTWGRDSCRSGKDTLNKPSLH